MPDVSFNGLFVVVLIALAAPLLIGLVPAIKVPAPVLLILAGIAVGPSGLGWVKIDLPLQILSLLGLAFLLFLAGLEIDSKKLRGRFLRLAGLGYAVSICLGLGVGFVFHAANVTKSPLLIAIALSATSLGLVVPILVDAGQSEKEVGQLAIAGSSVADFAAVVLVSVFFSSSGSGIGSKVVLLTGFAVLAIVAVLTLSRIGRSMRLGRALDMLQDTTAEIRIRFAVVMLIAFVVLASHFGLEAILGAFVAGFVINLIDHDSDSHPNFRVKLDAIGYGFLVPVFFVVSGLHFDLRGLVHSPSAFARIPLFLAALFFVRAVPALLYRSVLSWRGVLAAGFLQATSLPFLVTVSMIGVTLGAIKPITGSALVSAGVLSCMIFPLVSLWLLRTEIPTPPETDPAVGMPVAGEMESGAL